MRCVIVRASIAGLLAGAVFHTPAQAADLHWFYDSDMQGGGYEDTALQPAPDWRSGERAPAGDWRDRAAGPRYSVYQPEPRRHWPQPAPTSGMSCLEGVRLLGSAGFRHVEVVDCDNGDYVYDAVRRREPLRIVVNQDSGEIVDVERLGN